MRTCKAWKEKTLVTWFINLGIPKDSSNVTVQPKQAAIKRIWWDD